MSGVPMLESVLCEGLGLFRVNPKYVSRCPAHGCNSMQMLCSFNRTQPYVFKPLGLGLSMPVVTLWKQMQA